LGALWLAYKQIGKSISHKAAEELMKEIVRLCDMLDKKTDSKHLAWLKILQRATEGVEYAKAQRAKI
jgi:hypothetical protein